MHWLLKWRNFYVLSIGLTSMSRRIGLQIGNYLQVSPWSSPKINNNFTVKDYDHDISKDYKCIKRKPQ